MKLQHALKTCKGIQSLNYNTLKFFFPNDHLSNRFAEVKAREKGKKKGGRGGEEKGEEENEENGDDGDNGNSDVGGGDYDNE